MQRRTFVASALAAGTALAGSRAGFALADAGTATPAPAGDRTTQTAPETGYAPVNGLQMYYERHGTGEPLLLLHGAFGAVNLWGPMLTILAESRQVIAIDFQAHGRTADIDRSFGYEAFTEDVAAVMEHLAIEQADVVGYSMGANTGLQLALRYPEMVRKLVAISANYRTDGYYPEVWDVVATLTPELFAGSPLEAGYLDVAPDPEGFPILVERIKELDAIEYAWPDEDMQSIAAPTLLIIGDSDNVRPEHAAALFRLLGGGVPGDLTGLPTSQLAIIPGRTHITVALETPELLVSLIEPFLAAPMPEGA